LWIYGTGEFRFFASIGSGGFTSPTGDAGTLVQNMGGSFTYTAPDGSTDNFNISGCRRRCRTCSPLRHRDTENQNGEINDVLFPAAFRAE
jgi:hypothetical protein